MKLKLIFAAMGLSFCAFNAYSQTNALALEAAPSATQSDYPMSSLSQVISNRIKSTFESKFPGADVSNVQQSEIAGLYEVIFDGSNIIYSDESVRYVLQGSLIDVEKQADLTAKRIEQLQIMDFDALPFEDAIKQVRGTGEHIFATFEDPNCVFCKKLTNELKDLDNVTIYTFLFPILGDDSIKKSKDIWCSDDRASAWNKWMLDKIIPKSAPSECDILFEDNIALGNSLNVRGTPTIFFKDGSRFSGAMPLADFKAKLGIN